ncbi:hypothetical protein pb186bvf_003131 [Paramecium bursaria]
MYDVKYMIGQNSSQLFCLYYKFFIKNIKQFTFISLQFQTVLVALVSMLQNQKACLLSLIHTNKDWDLNQKMQIKIIYLWDCDFLTLQILTNNASICCIIKNQFCICVSFISNYIYIPYFKSPYYYVELQILTFNTISTFKPNMKKFRQILQGLNQRITLFEQMTVNAIFSFRREKDTNQYIKFKQNNISSNMVITKLYNQVFKLVKYQLDSHLKIPFIEPIFNSLKYFLGQMIFTK